MRGRVLAIVAVLALAGPASAQQVSLAIESAPEDRQITAGESVDLGSDVNITVSGVDCAEPVDLPVNLTADVSEPAPPPNASTTAEQGVLTFTVPQGSHHSETSGTPIGNESGPYQAVQTGTIPVSTASGVRQNYTAEVSIQAVFDGLTTETCVPQEFPSAQSDPVAVTLDVIADDPPEPESGDGGASASPPGAGTNGTNGTEGAPSDNGVPLGGALVPLAAAGAALVARRE